MFVVSQINDFWCQTLIRKTSTEKLFDLRIYHAYYIDFFQIREDIPEKYMHINIRMFKTNQYTISKKTHFFISEKGNGVVIGMCFEVFLQKFFFIFV